MVEKHIVCHMDNAKTVKFVYYPDQKSSTLTPKQIKSRPAKLELKEYPKGNYKWAILQTYSEKVDHRDASLRIDGNPSGGTGPNCHNDIMVANSKAPFCSSSLNSPYFSDQPKYDCEESGRIIFYTIFAEITSVDPDLCPSTYEFKFGLKWGIQMKEDKTLDSIPIGRMTKTELEKNVKIFSSVYCNRTFILNQIHCYKCAII